MWNARLDKAQPGIKIAKRDINKLRYTDDTTHMSESKEELKSLLMKVKEESEKAGWKLSIQKTKIMASGPITSWQPEGATMETVKDFILGNSKITAGEGNGNPHQHSCLKNPRDRAWWAAVYGVTQSRTRLKWLSSSSSSKITADGDCSHEIRRYLVLERKAMTNLDSILKNRDVTLPT